MNSLQKLEASLRSQLRAHKGLQWNTAKQIAASMRWQLGAFAKWLRMRQLFLAAASEAEQVASKVSGRIFGVSPHSQMTRHSGGGWSRRSSESERSFRSTAFEAAFIEPAKYAEAAKALSAWNKLSADIAQLFCEYEPLLYKRPLWLDIKRNCPIGGREAFALLMACDTGKKDRTLAGQHKLFGWHLDERFGESLSLIGQRINGKAIERKGAAPSLKAGYELLSKGRIRYAKPEPVSPLPYHRLAALRSTHRNSALIASIMLCGDANCVTASMLRDMRHGDKYANCNKHKRVAFKIMQTDYSHNTTSTILMGGFERLLGSDYYAPCLYRESSYRRDNAQWRTGFVVLRQGWNDTYHCDDVSDVDSVVSQLDSASSWYFRNKRDMAERALSTKQRLAKLLRRLRALPEVRIEHSYQTGNCRPGTADFMSAVGLFNCVKIDGRSLAVAWRRAKYTQQDRFAGVVIVAEAAYKAAQAEAARIAEAERTWQAACAAAHSDFASTEA